MSSHSCGVEGYKSSKCPERKNLGKRTKAKTYVTQVDEASVVHENVIVLQ